MVVNNWSSQNETNKNTDFIRSIIKTVQRQPPQYTVQESITDDLSHAACTEQESKKEQVHMYQYLPRCF